MTIYDKLDSALEEGINIKLLLIATGLDQYTFMQYLGEQLFDSYQIAQLRTVIREWRSIGQFGRF